MRRSRDNDGHFVLEDLGSRHGVWVNGERIEKSRRSRGPNASSSACRMATRFISRAPARNAAAARASPCPAKTGRAGSANLEKLRAVLEVAPVAAEFFSTDDVLNTVLDAALAVTGAERGFLLLFTKRASCRCAARVRTAGGDLPPDELRVPRRLIQQALESRRDLFSMSFDPTRVWNERRPETPSPISNCAAWSACRWCG